MMLYAFQFIAGMMTAFVAISAMTSPRFAMGIFAAMFAMLFVGLTGFAALVFVVAYF